MGSRRSARLGGAAPRARRPLHAGAAREVDRRLVGLEQVRRRRVDDLRRLLDRRLLAAAARRPRPPAAWSACARRTGTATAPRGGPARCCAPRARPPCTPASGTARACRPASRSRARRSRACRPRRTCGTTPRSPCRSAAACARRPGCAPPRPGASSSGARDPAASPVPRGRRWFVSRVFCGARASFWLVIEPRQQSGCRRSCRGAGRSDDGPARRPCGRCSAGGRLPPRGQNLTRECHGGATLRRTRSGWQPAATRLVGATLPVARRRSSAGRARHS